ncbi:MAG: aldolase/citrate lyase family protein [Pseudodesulfovibrio sp.]
MDLKEQMVRGDVSVGSWITLGHPAIAEIMCRAGFDWLAVDLEHSVITLREAEDLIRVINLHGVTSLVRLSDNDSVQIKRVMDAGAGGVIVPMVNSPEEAHYVVESVYYPPRGKRGVGLARAQGYGSNFQGYKTWLDSKPVIVVQIEHIDAVNALEDILAVDGVDGFIVGPYDLSASLGVPGVFDDSRFLDAMERIREVGGASGKVPGIHVVEPDTAATQGRIEEGYRFVAYSLDVRMLDVSCRKALDVIRG